MELDGRRHLDVLRKLYDALASGDFEVLMGLLATAYKPTYLAAQADRALAERFASSLTQWWQPGARCRAGKEFCRTWRQGPRHEQRARLDVTDGAPSEIWIYPGDLYAWDEIWS